MDKKREIKENQKSSPCQIGYIPHHRWYGRVLTILRNVLIKDTKCLFNDHKALECLSSLHEKYVIVPADKASNDIVFVCKAHYRNCHWEFDIDSNIPGYATYKRTTFDKDEIFNNHKTFVSSLNIGIKCED